MENYQPSPEYYDEFLDKDGKPRPHWKNIAEHFGRLEPDSWERRQRQLDRLIHDNGITYNVYGDESADLRPWSMDMLPIVLTSKEVGEIESALSQRATLLNILLSDVYGRQTMLQSSRMHPYLIYGNPAFLRPCHGLIKPRDKHIHVYAADIARSPDGKWWVLADRVEAASGLGYAIENRMLMSRIFPKILWESGTQALQPFINAFTSHIESLAPRNQSSPNVALLTAGPKNETYFEQSFLARNLGYTLAEGEDLTVRNNQLFMKTIGGVQRVDVLLRRIDSSWADPLELRNESLIGIPGLVNAVRQGNVAIANALGSGFVETTAMLAFLPWFCRNYLGESLEMPSVATWWCGQEKERKYVIENIDRLAIKPTFWDHRATSFFGPRLSSKEKEQLIARINYRPEAWCGQEIVSNATIPVEDGGKLHPRHFQLRVFLVPSKNGWKMMPGGFLRYASEENDVVVSMQRGGASKDTWVIRNPDEKQPSAPSPQISEVVAPRRQHNDLPSRTADNLFWLGRYVERAEALARILRSLCHMMVDDAGADIHRSAAPFLLQLTPPGSELADYLVPDTELLNFSKVENVIIKSLFDNTNIESLVSNFHAIEQTSLKVKERLSADTWKRLGALLQLAEASSNQKRSVFDDETLYFLDSALQTLASFIGNLMENTTRSQGWSFLEAGRRIERALSITFLLSSVYQNAKSNDENLIARILEWADSSITYRRRYLNTLRDVNLLEVICFDNANPRSLAFQTDQLYSLLKTFPHANTALRHPIDQDSLQLYSRIGLGNPIQLMNWTDGAPLPLLEFLDQTRDSLFSLGENIVQHYFAHTRVSKEPKPQQLA